MLFFLSISSPAQHAAHILNKHFQRFLKLQQEICHSMKAAVSLRFLGKKSTFRWLSESLGKRFWPKSSFAKKKGSTAPMSWTVTDRVRIPRYEVNWQFNDINGGSKYQQVVPMIKVVTIPQYDITCNQVYLFFKFFTDKTFFWSYNCLLVLWFYFDDLNWFIRGSVLYHQNSLWSESRELN